MASVWFSVLMLVLISFSQVIARNCSEIHNIKNCDECIRCGAIWCNDPKAAVRCSMGTDEWCLDHKELLEDPDTAPSPDVIRLGHHLDSYVKIGDKKMLNFELLSDTKVNAKVKTSVLKSTVKKFDPSHFRLSVEKVKYNEIAKKFTFTLVGIPTADFCPHLGNKESITVKVELEGQEGYSTVRFAVPCSCGCSAKAEKKSEQCNKRGDYACGACACEKGWEGDSCLVKESSNNIPHCDRGDIVTMCINSLTNTLCSDNGRCDCSGQCQCFKELPGSEYFDSTCDDICSTTGYCDGCLLNPTMGLCKDCGHIYLEPLNTTVLDLINPVSGRNVWYNCTEQTDSCNIQYAAMKDKNGTTHVMIIDSCQPIADQYASGIRVTVPVTLGVIAIVAAMAAVAGYMVYKNRTPPLPLTDPQYQNIDAEDCTGENPLYKPPTSSFKNPTYGKW